jgi:Tfp pilus assembly protein PilF
MTEPSKDSSPPPLPGWVTPPVPNPADANKKSYNPSLLILAGLIAILIFASIVILGIVVSRLSFQQMAGSNSSTTLARFGRAKCYYQLHDYDHVIEDCTALIQRAPRFADAYRLRAQAYQQKQQSAQANADLQTAQRLQPK